MTAPPPPDDLEARLDAAFAATETRPGFEGELWRRIQATPLRPGLRQRLAAGLAFPGRMSLAPALAALAVVALAGTVVLVSRGPHGGGAGAGGTASSSAPLKAGPPADSNRASGVQSGSAAAPAPRAAGFGPLPRPELGNPRSAELATDSGAVPYFDSAELSWSGQLPNLPATLPVFRYAEPQKPEEDAFAARLGATPNPAGSGYSASDLNLAVFPSTLANGREAIYALTPKNGATSLTAPTDDAARASANSFLAAHQLAPDWDSVSAIRRFQGLSVVRFSREFAVPGSGFGVQIDSSGKQVGLDVLVRGDGTVFQVSGPFPFALEPAAYRARGRDDALKDALSQSVPGQPRVTLTRATLVYEAIADGDHGFYVPALLFTGVFQQAGQTYEKRLLVQILDPSGLR